MKEMMKRILKAGLPVPGFVRPVGRALYRIGVVITEMLIFIRKFFFVEPVLRCIAEVGKGLRADRLPYIRGCGTIVLGDNVNLSGRSCFYFMDVAGENPGIKIGNNVFIGNGCTLAAARSIEVGDNVLISAGVRIHDNDGHLLEAERRIKGEQVTGNDIVPVVVEEGAWIGAEAIILKGVRVGRNAVVGAGAVVTRDVPANTVVAGNPAIVVKEL